MLAASTRHRISCISMQERLQELIEEATLGPTRCPLCGYSLAGLPKNHRCPECGFAYDEHTRVFRMVDSRWRNLEFALPIICLVGIGAVLWPTFAAHSGGYIHLAFVAGVLLCFGWVIRSMARMKDVDQKGRCVAITPRGLFIRDFTTEEWIEWTDLGRLVYSPEFQYFTRRSSVKTTPVPLNLKNEKAREAFVKIIEHARATYLAKQSNPASSQDETNMPVT